MIFLQLCSRFTCDVVTKCIFSADAKAFESEDPEIRNEAKKIFGSSFLSLIKITMMEVFPTLFKALRIGFVPKDTEAFFRDLMRQATEYRQNNDINSQDYLDYLLQMKKKKGLSDLEVAANGISFFLDGLETSAIGIAHMLFEVSIIGSIKHFKIIINWSKDRKQQGCPMQVTGRNK